MSLRDLERELLADKPWPLRGEVDGSHRPKDSLLLEHFQFNRRKGPQINEPLGDVDSTIREAGERVLEQSIDPLSKTSEYLEQLIKNRICNNLFDSVKPLDPKALMGEEGPSSLIDTDELNVTKDSTGLADAYVPSTTTAKRVAEKLKEQQDEVIALWKKTERMLDAFCSDSWIPKATVIRTAAERAEKDQVNAV
eukprot:Protomagalhaensia_wolfi_Nauph_80__3750@NODE_3790_length_710_cov_3_250373_g2990_i0_p1_GENE_NODE_3790_length_710_cov_3_250373_g2990_i0NODE_3790_length_710_cov_3_250373_g2990_i0_p1_ORF_typecomplete_len195_score59_28Mpp10/PF04006_12/3_6e29_NODE_3790_length_710_cov_3_250373_g2990_i066650